MGKIYVVGIGPGGPGDTTPRVEAALAASDVLVGYTTYIQLVRERYPEKEIVATPMTTEVERCRACRELALGGKTVSMVCSGDAGVYGMAGLVHQVCRDVLLVLRRSTMAFSAPPRRGEGDGGFAPRRLTFLL